MNYYHLFNVRPNMHAERCQLTYFVIYITLFNYCFVNLNATDKQDVGN